MSQHICTALYVQVQGCFHTSTDMVAGRHSTLEDVQGKGVRDMRHTHLQLKFSGCERYEQQEERQQTRQDTLPAGAGSRNACRRPHHNICANEGILS